MKTLAKQKFRCELQRLEKIIQVDVADFLKDTPHFEQEFLPDFHVLITEEAQNIKENLRLSVFVLGEANDVRHHIQYHQHLLMTLAGHLLTYTAPEHLDYTQHPDAPRTFSQILYDAIEDLLDFIRTHFPEHFDPGAWIPIPYQRIARHRLCCDLSDLRVALLHRGVTLDLVAIAMIPLRQFSINKSPNRVTYRTVAYLDQLKTRLLRLASSFVDKPSKRIVELLCEINFNSPEFVAHCIAYMKFDMHSTLLVDDGGPLMLYRFRKLLLQTQPAVDVALNPSLPPLQDTLCAWIDAELWFSGSAQPSQNVPSADGWTGIIARIIISLTGGQLSYLFSILIEIGVVKNTNKKELGNILSTVFQTTKASGQADSYRQQLYRDNIRVKKTIESILDKMLQLVRKDLANPGLK
jgi:hypothetical protein